MEVTTADRHLEIADHPPHTATILRAATLALTQSLELDNVLNALLEYLAQLVPYDAANVMLRVSDTQIAMLAIRGYEHWADPDQIRRATYDIDTNVPARALFTTRRSVLIPDTATYPGWDPAAGAEFVRSWMGIPLIAEHEVIGLFSLDKAEPGYFTSEHVHLAEALAAHAVIAIQNARLHERLRQQTLQLEVANRALQQEAATRARAEQTLRFFAETSAMLATSLDYGPTMKSIAAMAVPRMADYCMVHVIEPGGEYRQVAAAHIIPQKAKLLDRLAEIYHPRFSATPEFLRRAMHARVPVFIENVATNVMNVPVRDAQALEIYRALDPISFMIIPLVARGQLRGTLTLARAESQQAYTREDLAIAEELAPRVALAIDNARLYQAAQAAVQRQNESLALLNMVLSAAPVGLAFQDCDLRFVHINDMLAQINGLPPDQQIGRRLRDFAPHLAEFVEPRLRQVLAAGEPLIDIEIQGHLPGSTAQRHWLASYYPVRTPNDEMLGVGTIVADITARKHSEDELRRQKEILQHIFDQAPIMLAFFNPHGEFQFVNREWERVLGWSYDEMQGRDILAEFYPDPVIRAEAQAAIFNPQPGWHEFQTRVRDGRVLDTSWANVQLSDGTYIAIGQDISERKRLEARFFQSQKMESVGRLAGGVAHDFNNLLTVIIGFVELAMLEVEEPDPLYANLLEIRRAADRAASLTRQLLAFARKQIISPQPTNLNDLIFDMDRLLRRLIGEDIELIIQAEPALALVKVDTHQIEQVLVNLVVNARDAMPHGGTLRISTSNIVLDRQFASEHVGAAAGSHALITVSDSGIGMSEQTRAHAFEPFYTTKPLGQGTGLGLATCYGIVKQHDGYITVDSAVGQGTTVSIYLPVTADPAAGVAPNPQQDVLPHGDETILLVEDEGSVRRMTAQMLRELGYRVVEAANGERALDSVLGPAAPAFDLLLTDVVMPRMGGVDLAARLGALRPTLPVLYMSGYTDNQIARQGDLQDGAMFIQKPFSRASLARKLRELLDQ